MPPSENSNGHGGASPASSSERAAPRSPPTPAKGKGRKKKEDDDLPEEDLELKERLQLCAVRPQDPNPGVQNVALESMRQEICTATSSMTSVPKPVKFLRPHYRTLKAYFETMSQSDLKSSMADIMSVLALTMSPEGERESLKYQLMGSKDDIGSRGHEYVRNLADEIAQNDQVIDICIMDLVMQIVEFHMKGRVVASLENSETFHEKTKKYCDVTLTSLAYAGTGDVLQVLKLLDICSQHLEEGETHQGPAVHGIALIAMAEELGAEMAVRSLEHFLQYSEQNIRRAVPLALGVLFISNPKGPEIGARLVFSSPSLRGSPFSVRPCFGQKRQRPSRIQRRDVNK